MVKKGIYDKGPFDAHSVPGRGCAVQCSAVQCKVMGAYRGPSPSRPVHISHNTTLSASPGIPPIKTCHVGDFPRRHLSEDLIRHQPPTRPQARASRAGLTLAATISIAYLVFFVSPLRVSCCMGVCGAECPVTKSASGNVGLGDHFSLIRNIPHVHAERKSWASGTHPGRPREIVGSRSSGVPGRPGPGTGGSSQKVC